MKNTYSYTSDAGFSALEIVLSLALVAVIGIAGFYAYKNNSAHVVSTSSPTSSVKISPTSSPAIKPTSTQTPTPTHGFAIKELSIFLPASGSWTYKYNFGSAELSLNSCIEGSITVSDTQISDSTAAALRQIGSKYYALSLTPNGCATKSTQDILKSAFLAATYN
jgi:hypothetical protein